MALEYFCAYHSYLDAIEPLTDAERGRLFVACLEYSKSGATRHLSGNERFIFPMLRAQIDRDKAAYQERCKTNRANGIKGGNASGTGRGQSLPTGADRPPTPPKEKEKENTKAKENNSPPVLPDGNTAPKGRMVPPTVDEVAAYCQERGNGLDPETFVDFYASKGWMVGKNPMKDWKAAVRTWERSEGRGASGAGNRVQPRATEEHGLDKLRRLYEEEFGVE